MRRYRVMVAGVALATVGVTGCTVSSTPPAQSPPTSSAAAVAAEDTSPDTGVDAGAVAAEQPEDDALADLTVEQQEAVQSAASYLQFGAFSKQGLIDQLEYEGYSTADAELAVTRVDVDWKEQAAKSAASYLQTSSFSRQGLLEQLEYEGFTKAQARYGVDVAYGGGEDSDASGGSVSQQNAIRSAESYLQTGAFSKSGLASQLEYEGFSPADAQFAVDQVDVDWNEQAAKSAESYLQTGAFSRQALIDQLLYEGFTRAQATYGVDAAGL